MQLLDDRFYNATETMLKTESLDSYYLIRGKYHVFKKTTGTNGH